MKFQAILTRAADAPVTAFAPHIVAEERQVWADYAAGRLREMYFQPDPLIVILVFEAEDRDFVATLLATYPMVAARLFDVQIIALGPWLPLTALFAPGVLD